MAFTRQTENVSIHQQQDLEPNDVGGLSGPEFQEVCDEAANILNDYINDTFLPELESTTDGSSGAKNIGLPPIANLGNVTNVEDALKAAAQLPNLTEVINSRNGYSTLKDRLDNFDTQFSNNTTKLNSMTINVLYPPAGLTPVNYNNADNSTAINAMINYLSPGGELFFPVGTCNITNPIIISKSQITLKGMSQRSVIQNNGTSDAIQINGTSGASFNRIKFEGLRVEGNVNSGYGLKASYVVTRLIIRDCEFSYHGDAGIYTNECYSMVIDSTNSSGNCRKASPTKLANTWLSVANNLEMIGCHFVNSENLSDGFRIVNSYAVDISGCQFEDNARHGITIETCSGVNLDGNYYENNGSGYYGLNITGSPGLLCHGININGGYFNGAGINSYGIVIGYADAVMINAIYGKNHTTATVRITTTGTNVICNNVTTSATVGETDPNVVSDSGTATQILIGNLAGTDYHIPSGKYLQLGAYYGWTVNGQLRIAGSRPTADTDGYPCVRFYDPPASATATGKKGDVYVNSTYAYFCVNTNTWVRCPVATW